MGKIISFEGIDGSGKSSICEGVKDLLERDGKKVLLLREPGSTQLGNEIRTIVKSDTPRAKLAEAMLFLAARADMVENIVRPFVKHYDVILIDRYIDSTTAYQGYGHQQDINTISALNRAAVGNSIPDLTVLVTVPLEVAEKRLKERGGLDRFETDKSFMKRVEKGYNEIRKSEPDRVKAIDNDDLRTAINDAYELVCDSVKRRKQHKRQSLAKLAKIESGRFKAIVGRIGRDEKDKPTILLQQIKRVNGRKVLADHAWAKYNRELIKVGTLLPNDVIEFDASIEPYEHVGKNGATYEEYGITDISNVTITKARHVKKNEDDFARESLDRLLAITDEKLFDDSMSRYLRYVTAMTIKHFNA